MYGYMCVCNWKTSHFHCFFVVFFLSLFMIECAWRRKSSPFFIHSSSLLSSLSLVYFSFFFISLPRCQEKKTVAHHIDYSELGFFFYLIILCCCCDECVCVGLGEITFIFSEKKISVFIKALGMSLESKNI